MPRCIIIIEVRIMTCLKKRNNTAVVDNTNEIAMLQLEVEVILAEFNAIRAEITTRIQATHTIFAISATILSALFIFFTDLLPKNGKMENIVLATVVTTPNMRAVILFACILLNGLAALTILNSKGNTACAQYIDLELRPRINEITRKTRGDYEHFGWRNFRKNQSRTIESKIAHAVLYSSYFLLSYISSLLIFCFTAWSNYNFGDLTSIHATEWTVITLIIMSFIIIGILGIITMGRKDFLIAPIDKNKPSIIEDLLS